MAIGVRYYSMTDDSGYGSAALPYIQALIEQGIPLRWSPLVETALGLAPWELLPHKSRTPLDGQSSRQDALLPHIDCDIDYDTQILHMVPELFPKLVDNNKHNIGYTVWETDALPKHWPDLLQTVDQLMVPCTFNRDVFDLPGGPSVSVVPHMLAWNQWTSQKPELAGFRATLEIAEDTCVFYCISAWAPRKAMWETLHTYLLAFTERDDVCLVVKTEPTGIDLTPEHRGKHRPTQEMIDEIVTLYPDPARIVLVDRFIDESELAGLHATSDCYFSLAHSEGWGLGAYAAAEFGNPVIITGWGGHTDYLPHNLAYLIDYSMIQVEPVVHWESYTSDQQWARADTDHAIDTLRHVYQHREEARQRGGQLQQYVRHQFSSAVISATLLEALNAGNP